MPQPEQVREMFARIAGRYDLLNRVLSFGIDRSWRRRTVRAAGPLIGRVTVDACCGTGDLSFAFARAGSRVIGVDFTREMLLHTRAKDRHQTAASVFTHGDALRLPVKSSAADIASVAFGLRNLADPDAGLVELARVVKPGGRVLVLEFSPPPRGLLGSLYRFYFARLLPLVGGWVSGEREAYRYLPRSVTQWMEPQELVRRMESAGLSECGYELLSCGITSLHWGRVAPR